MGGCVSCVWGEVFGCGCCVWGEVFGCVSCVWGEVFGGGWVWVLCVGEVYAGTRLSAVYLGVCLAWGEVCVVFGCGFYGHLHCQNTCK